MCLHCNKPIKIDIFMKQVVNAGIGGRSFVMDNDAYLKLNNYLNTFKAKMKMGVQTKEVMDDLEERIAELFAERLNSFKDVVDITMVNMVIAQMGMPDGEPFIDGEQEGDAGVYSQIPPKSSSRKFYRDSANKSIGGVCGGLAVHFNVDVVLVRVLFVLCFFMGSASFWVYIILWIVSPLAVTPAQKCEMYGLPVTAENMNKFSNKK